MNLAYIIYLNNNFSVRNVSNFGAPLYHRLFPHLHLNPSAIN